MQIALAMAALQCLSPVDISPLVSSIPTDIFWQPSLLEDNIWGVRI